MSRLIISIHIPKTAGTSFGAFLEQAFKGKIVFVTYCLKCKGIIFDVERAEISKKRKEQCDTHNHSIAEVAQFVRRNNIKCVHGHIRPADIYPYFPQAEYVVWLRDPVERAISHFEFFKRLPASDWIPPKELAAIEKNDLQEFVWLVGNVQTYWIPGFALRRFSFVGVVEEFEQDLKRFCSQFGIVFTGIPQKNVNPNKKTDRYPLDAETRKIIERANLNDIALYAKGVQMRGKENSVAYSWLRLADGTIAAWAQRFPLAGQGVLKVKAYGQKLKRYVRSKFK